MGVYEDGTYYIEYLEDGSVETFVPASYIRSLDEIEEELHPGNPKKNKSGATKLSALPQKSRDKSFVPDKNVDFRYNWLWCTSAKI